MYCPQDLQACFQRPGQDLISIRLQAMSGTTSRCQSCRAADHRSRQEVLPPNGAEYVENAEPDRYGKKERATLKCDSY